jgi:predicted DCC family thiol-disulfide oxidoreductase YuxK
MVNAFSDGVPAYEFLVFLTLTCIFALAARSPAVNRWATGVQKALAEFIRNRQALPEQDLFADLRVLEVVRIVTGSMAAIRYGEIVWSSVLYGSAVPFVAAVAAGLALLVAVGLFTPIATVALMASANVLVDNALGASTLGTQVLSMILLMVFLAPAGRTLSLDAILARTERAGVVIRAMHRWTGPPSSDRLLVVKIVALFAYYCVCLYSAIWHLRDPAWTSGLVIAWVLLSPAHNLVLYDAVVRLYEWSPFALVTFSRVATLGMWAWYLLVLPGLFLGRATRAFAMYWGLAFFLISAFVLRLGLLGKYELLLWIALFATARPFRNSSHVLTVLFDDRCRLCDFTVRTLSTIDVFHRLDFLPIRANQELLSKQGVTLADSLQDIVGVEMPTGRRWSGFELYSVLAHRLVALWPLLPLFWLLSLTGAGPAIYRYIAERRTRLFGVCETSTLPGMLEKRSAYRASAMDPRAGGKTFDVRTERVAAAPVAIVMTFVVLASAFLIRLPIGHGEPDGFVAAAWSRSIFGAAPLAFGIGRINVFNAEDLSVARRRLRVYAVRPAAPSTSEHLRRQLELRPVENDAQTFWITAHLRAASRQNVGCDRDFFEATAPQIIAVSRRIGVTESKIVVEIVALRPPTESELGYYQFIAQAESPICEALIDRESGTIETLSYHEAGVSLVLAERDYRSILNVYNAESAVAYPCRLDAAFVGAIVDGHLRLNADEDLLHAIGALYADKPGRFTIDCLMDIWDLTNRWPEITSPFFVNPTPASCAAGGPLLQALADLPTLAAETTRRIREQHEVVVRAQAERDWRGCLDAILLSRATIWAQLLKPPPTETAEQREFVQKRLDAHLAHLGGLPVLAGRAIQVAFAYPCRVDAGLIGTIVDGHAELNADENLIQTIRALFADMPGRIDCLMNVRDIVTRWPKLTDPSFVNPTPANCASGERLLADLRALPALPADVAARIREQHDNGARARADSNWRECLNAALEGRAATWRYLLKPDDIR